MIATDSKWRSSKSGSIAACKILQVNKCFFLIVGLRYKPETHFDSTELEKKACEFNGVIEEKVRFFAKAVRGPLRQALEYSRLHDSKVYRRDYLGKVVVQGIFVTRDIPKIISESFVLMSSGKLKEEWIQIPNQAGNSIISGVQEAIQRFRIQNPSWEDGRYIVETARKYLELEITDKPQDVGPPVSILVIDRLVGPHWIEQGVCPGIEKAH
ncbi:MAG: hypothetical protein WCA27_01730 [Candidatus Sulfotelmatobacter sp.]